MTKNGCNKIIEKDERKEDSDLEFIAYALGPDSGPYSDSKTDNYPRRILGAYFSTFSACEKRSPQFENYDVVLVLDREGRIPYYSMHAYCKKHGQPVPDENRVFFMKTSGFPSFCGNALAKAVSKSNSKLVRSAYEQRDSIWFKHEDKGDLTPTELRNLYTNEDPELFEHIILNRDLKWEKEALRKEADVWNSEILAAEFTRALKLPKEQRYEVSRKSQRRGCGIDHRAEQIEKELLPKVSDYYVYAMNLIKTAPKGTQFHHQLEKIATKEKPRILLVDASSCDGKQIAATRKFLKEVYGYHLDFDSYITTHVLYGSRCEDPLIILRDFLGIIPSNVLDTDGFKIEYKENNQEICKRGFMEGDKIGAELQDKFVNGIRTIGEYLVNDYNNFKNIKSDKGEFGNYLISNPNLLNILKEVDKIAKDFEK